MNTTTFSTLRTQSQQTSLGATAKPPTSHQSCDVIVRLEAPPDTQNGRLSFQATALFDGPHTQAGQTDTYVARPERTRECLENLNKGAGSGPGSVLAFGNAWRDQESNTVSIGWVNTAISAQKAKGELNHHHHRRIEMAFAQMPVLDFTNVNRAPGEPERVRWPLGLDTIQARAPVDGRWQTAIFHRDWLKDKLQATWEARHQDQVSLNLRLPILYPEQAMRVRNSMDARTALHALLKEHPYRSILTRISDGQAVETRWQPLMRGADVTEWAAQLLSQTPGYDQQGRPVADPDTGEQVRVDRFSLIQGVNNDLLFDAAQQGQLDIEFLPREALLVASKNAVGLANDIKQILQAETAADLRSVAFTFGNDPEAIARVALVLQQQGDRTYVVSGPFRLDTLPSYTVATVPSPYLRLPSQPIRPTQDVDAPLESATVQDIPPLSAEDDFTLDAATLDAVLDHRPSPIPITATTTAHPAATLSSPPAPDSTLSEVRAPGTPNSAAAAVQSLPPPPAPLRRTQAPRL